MPGVSVRPVLIGACTLLLGLLGANAALAGPSLWDSCRSEDGIRASGHTRGGASEDREGTRAGRADTDDRRSERERDEKEGQGHHNSGERGGETDCTKATPGTGETTTPTGTGETTTPTGATGSSGTGTSVTVTVIPAGPISWAPGFGPNGVAATVQTAPRSVARLPSTSTAGGNNEPILWGIASVAGGLVLLSAGGRRSPAALSTEARPSEGCSATFPSDSLVYVSDRLASSSAAASEDEA
jgi:hypothetical protein